MTPVTAPPKKPKVLISVADLERRITQLAAEIDRDYAGSEPILCIGVLKGSVFFMVDLLKQVKTPLQIGFFQTSSYGGGTRAGEIRIRKDGVLHERRWVSIGPTQVTRVWRPPASVRFPPARKIVETRSRFEL